MENISELDLIPTGAKVRELLTGFEGVVTVRAHYLFGSAVRYGVQALTHCRGVIPDYQWLDHDQLEVIGMFEMPKISDADLEFEKERPLTEVQTGSPKDEITEEGKRPPDTEPEDPDVVEEVLDDENREIEERIMADDEGVDRDEK